MDEVMFYAGITLMAAAAAAAVAAIALFIFSKKRLKSQLEAEFGKKRH